LTNSLFLIAELTKASYLSKQQKQETSIWTFFQWAQYKTIWKKTMFWVSMK
jgi:hypothetical protein